MGEKYDSIGRTYSKTRAADPRIVAELVRLLSLSPGDSILDVGAGCGNYSFALAESGFKVTELEPSAVMRNQGQEQANLSWESGHAESLLFEDGSFDSVVMTLSMHHFDDWKRALSEAVRVTRAAGPIVIFTFIPSRSEGFWLFDYFPSVTFFVTSICVGK